MDKEIIDEETKADSAAGKYREEIEPNLKNGVGKHYWITLPKRILKLNTVENIKTIFKNFLRILFTIR